MTTRSPLGHRSLAVPVTSPVGTCHCGAVRLVLPSRPRVLVSCNCSICRRYGTLWTYFRADRVRVEHPKKGTQAYAWGQRRLRFVRCARCGCVTHWEAARPSASSRMGVNARLLEPVVLEGIRVRRLDGARTWKFLD
jgi:hypothetical protein